MQDLIGEEVYAKEYGDGKIQEITDKKIKVKFAGTIQTFNFPDAFSYCLISRSKKIDDELKNYFKNGQCENWMCGLYLLDCDDTYCRFCKKKMFVCSCCREEYVPNKKFEHYKNGIPVCSGCYYDYFYTNERLDGLEFPLPYEKIKSMGVTDREISEYLNIFERIRALNIASVEYIKHNGHKKSYPNNKAFIEEIKKECNIGLEEELNEFYSRHFGLPPHSLWRLNGEHIWGIDYKYFEEVSISGFMQNFIQHNKICIDNFNVYLSADYCREIIERRAFSSLSENEHIPFTVDLHLLCPSDVRKFVYDAKEKSEEFETKIAELTDEKNMPFKNREKWCDEFLNIFYNYGLSDDFFNAPEIHNLKMALIPYTDASDYPKIEDIKFSPRDDILYIYKGINIKCKLYGHKIFCVNAKIPTKNEGTVLINVNYCPVCQKFIISEAEFKHYKKLYKILLTKLQYVESSGDFPVSFEAKNINEFSPLKLCGYEVSKTSNLSVTERQTILSYIIDNDIMKKHDVIRYLNQFIDYNGRKDNMSEAVNKWIEDLDFVRNYNMDKQKSGVVNYYSKY